MKRRVLFFASALLLAPAAQADELRLKDGTKVVGKIVSFEDNSFKVETSYGYAVVRKDAVAMILVSDAAKKSAPEKKPTPPATTKASPPPESPRPAPATDLTRPKSPPASMAAKPAAAMSPPAPPPVKAHPEPMREEVEGNTYTNETYGFRIYKPPSWNVIEGARKMLPGAIVAMGTNDEATYLLVGQEPLGRSLESHVAPTEKRLREIMENYRPLGEGPITVSGSLAVERRFRGRVDERD